LVSSRKLVPNLESLLATFYPEFDINSIGRQSAVPALAKDQEKLSRLGQVVDHVPTQHRLVLGDARDMKMIEDTSVHLAITSPPYWTLKKYNSSRSQLGDVKDYEEFNAQLAQCWSECFRVLVPGGRLVVIVGDVCLSRRQYGRHVVFPLHATIQESCRRTGFDNLALIIWHKIANAKYEAGGGGFLGKPYEPNAVIKNDVEYILMQRKPGGYRKPTLAMRALSVISDEQHKKWFQQIWQIGGASTKRHPAPFPLELANRLIRMFSFVGDTVLDPFSGTATVSVACAQAGRNSIAVEVDPEYYDMGLSRLRIIASSMFSQAVVLAEASPNAFLH